MIEATGVDSFARTISQISLSGTLLASLVVFLAYRRDRSRLHVRFAREMRLLGTEDLHAKMQSLIADLPEVLGEDATEEIMARLESDATRYDPKKLWTYITVVNSGRRPIKFQKAGLLIRGQSPLVAGDSKVTLLSEGDSLDIPVDEEALRPFEQEVGSVVYAAFAQDILGIVYYSPLPFFIKLKAMLGFSPIQPRKVTARAPNES